MLKYLHKNINLTFYSL